VKVAPTPPIRARTESRDPWGNAVGTIPRASSPRFGASRIAKPTMVMNIRATKNSMIHSKSL
jgi:hypothetical protein